MSIPLEEGFTVVTGPNGSGKSNILDGVLFCLGLANSRGMRADRLPDLVNSGVLKAGKSSETKVTVKFDLTDWQPDDAEEGIEPTEEGPWIKPDQKEWTVSRRLKVMPGGSYASTYSADGETCNLQQLQTQLRRLRIDPEGSNVVMQGDVTRIVSMSNKDRRGLIDELAGVALFDTRINQTRTKLDEVYESQERCRIVEQELILSKQRLQKDCEKASLYKDLKNQFSIGRQQELVLSYENAKKGLKKLEIKQRKYKTQVINGLEKKMVTPPKSFWDRIKKENKVIKEVRSLDSNVDFIFQKFDWPTKGIISGVFGSQRILNGKPKRPHYGVDIAAPEGTDILAPTKAIVRMAEKDLYYTGGTVMLDHGHGVTSVYSHLSSINVKVGDKINKGQKIGEVGSTGRSTGPHLDWRINWFSERLDPALFIKK